MSTIKLFEIVGNDFFRVLTGKYQSVFIDCLEIIYESYRTELSYGVDRDVIIALLTDYFEKNGSADIQFEDEAESLKDSKSKASMFLRKLKDYGWIEYDIGKIQLSGDTSFGPAQNEGIVKNRKSPDRTHGND